MLSFLSFSPPPPLKIAFLRLPDPSYSPLARAPCLYLLVRVVAMATWRYLARSERSDS